MANYDAIPNQTPQTTEQLQHEELSLLKIQADQSKILEEKGTLVIAREKFRQHQAALRVGKTALGKALQKTPRPMTRTSVVLTPAFYLNQPDREPKLVPGIRFTTVLPSEDATEIVTHKTIPVGELAASGSMKPCDGFSQKDLLLVMDMVHGLEQARDMGVVPNINQTLSTIVDPARHDAIQS